MIRHLPLRFLLLGILGFATVQPPILSAHEGHDDEQTGTDSEAATCSERKSLQCVGGLVAKRDLVRRGVGRRAINYGAGHSDARPDDGNQKTTRHWRLFLSEQVAHSVAARWHRRRLSS